MSEQKIPKIVKKVLPGVVSITISKNLTVYQKQPFGFSFSGRDQDFMMVPKGKKQVKVGGGSGFIVDSEGIILTNRHVVADPKAEYVVLLNNDQKYKAKVQARDVINEVAILKINVDQELPTIELGDSSKLELGEKVIAIGNALGTFKDTVSTGVVSGLSREITAGDLLHGQKARLRGVIQTDAAVNPGNSGGPLLNIEGEVIGVNAATVFLAENIGFAIPINTAKKDLKELKQYGRIRRPFLGVRYIPITKALKRKYDFPVQNGALVVPENYPGGQAVVEGSPAQKAGIKKGDIILQVEQQKIDSKNHLQEILQKHKVGDEISLRVFRKGEQINLKTKLEERK